MAAALRVSKAAGRIRRVYPSAAAIADLVGVSEATVRRDLRHSGFQNRARPKHPLLLEGDFIKRKAFAVQMFKDYNVPQLQQIAFSDEKLFDTNDHGNRREWVAPGSKPTPRVFEKWAPKVMVWGIIGKDYRSLHFFAPGVKVDAGEYQKAILPRLKSIKRRGLRFQQDGARCHTAKSTADLLTASKVLLLDGFPARSPDLSPIEHMWSLVQGRMSEFLHLGLKEAVKKSWDAIPVKTVNSLVGSFPARLLRCDELDGRFVD